MIALVTLLVALPAGYLLRTRQAALTTYAVAYLWAFVFQGVYLLLGALGPDADESAFAPGECPWAYGVVALLILAVGVGLVEAGHRLALRRARARTAPVAEPA